MSEKVDTHTAHAELVYIGEVKCRADTHGGIIVRLPRAYKEDLRVEPGDVVRFYRRPGMRALTMALDREGAQTWTDHTDEAS